jgi:hypothetical protein
MYFLYFILGRRVWLPVWLPGQLTVIQEAAYGYGVLPYRNHFDSDAPFAPPGFRQPDPSEKHLDHCREITKSIFSQLAIE